MTGTGIGELDISSSGDRILFGQLVSTDSAGNRYWHLYMNVGDSAQSIDLMPGNAEGALFDGMSADGTAVYFTTPDTPSGALGGDGDTSADIFRADVIVHRRDHDQGFHRRSRQRRNRLVHTGGQHAAHLLELARRHPQLRRAGDRRRRRRGLERRTPSTSSRPRSSMPRIPKTNPSKVPPTSTSPDRAPRRHSWRPSSRPRTLRCLPLPASLQEGIRVLWQPDRNGHRRFERRHLRAGHRHRLSEHRESLQVRLRGQPGQQLRRTRRSDIRRSRRPFRHADQDRRRQLSGEPQLSRPVRPHAVRGIGRDLLAVRRSRVGPHRRTAPLSGSGRSESTGHIYVASFAGIVFVYQPDGDLGQFFPSSAQRPTSRSTRRAICTSAMGGRQRCRRHSSGV